MTHKEFLQTKRELLESIISNPSHLDKNDPIYQIYIDETIQDLFDVEKELSNLS
ncbi:hypothetical protein D3C84_1200100 [compost metagenome]